MDELRLEGVHDDGEHLVLSDAQGRRSLLAVDQQLRQAVQRARRVPARRHRQGADFGPRDIQARFRAGATLDEIVEESGWEPERVRRYEWPILAERGHMAREAQKVELGTRRTEGYRSAFEGAPLTLSQTLETRAPELGIAAGSFDWDAWQRPDLLWTVAVRFRVADPAKAPQDLVDQQSAAHWVFNPANLSVTPEPGWAQHLTREQQPDSPLDSVLGQPRSDRGSGAGSAASSSAASGASAASETSSSAGGTEASGAARDEPGAEASAPAGADGGAQTGPASDSPADVQRLEHEDSRSTEELLDVLDARRGQRLGADEDSDDQLAAILGRSMSHVDSRPRPISAPDDAQLFQQTIQPARSASDESEASRPGQDAEQAPASRETASPQEQVDEDRTPEASEAAQETDPSHHHEATIHHLGRADAGAQHHSDIVEITDDDAETAASASRSASTGSEAADAGRSGSQASESRSSEGQGSATKDSAAQGSETQRGDSVESAGDDSAKRRPRPRGKVGGSKRTRSSVPSWDDIVFGAKND